ncbi:hypothetical protein SAMN05443574_1354 [Haloarcula vallismortis]|uniref:Uncharacterized protein n=2 Tax=Haloarcula vallismortis TaxID=28442 RepID=M0J8F1_HALVA|nr:hypothetical protein [Haloarcula vallismortis]EMA04279.1 hypothetical protein C437_14002 [Haloarcula vallismortis ATCC 29715]SDX35268.1 hypothetical protein SAMN05443574_1354 [Haloarcula vallismortis]
MPQTLPAFDEGAVEFLSQKVLPGDPQAYTDRVERLEALLDRESTPTPVAVFRAWFGPSDLPSAADAHEHVAIGAVGGFDPADDPRTTSDKITVAEAYDRTLEQGFDDAAVYLRVLEGDRQREFAHLVRRACLD